MPRIILSVQKDLLHLCRNVGSLHSCLAKVEFMGTVDCRYITEDDLIRFMPEEDAIRALALFDGAMETGKITKKALKSWVVRAVCLLDMPRLNFTMLLFVNV